MSFISLIQEIESDGVINDVEIQQLTGYITGNVINVLNNNNLLGSRGAQGPQGVIGAQGDTGVGIVEIIQNLDSSVTFIFSDDTSFTSIITDNTSNTGLLKIGDISNLNDISDISNVTDVSGILFNRNHFDLSNIIDSCGNNFSTISLKKNLSDGNHNIINKTISGGLVIDVNTGDNSPGGLKIFNSGGTHPNSLAYPQISLIPYHSSSPANTLGNPTIIGANNDNAAFLQGPGNLNIYSGPENFSNFNIWQGNGTTSLGSNVIQSAHLHHNEYRLSLNKSENDTDVIINTPNYNDTSNNPAMIVDSGLNNITFHAPVNFENSVTVDGNSLSLIEEYLFNTSNIPPGNWFTLATTGDGSNRNVLRSDALFILEGRLGSHHHAIIFRAGAKFNSGIYINVLESSWYTSPRIQALRIAYLSTHDGSVLQAQLANGSSAQNTSNITLRIYQNKNNAGWISSLTTSPLPNNNPVVYVTDNPTNPGATYSNFRHSGNIIYDPHNRNTTQTTTSESYFENGNIYLKGGDVIVDGGVIDMSNGNINNINILDGNNSAGGTTTLRSNSSGIGSSSAYINFDSPIRLPTAAGPQCLQSLNNADPATLVYNSDNNTLLHKSVSSSHPQTTNYLHLSGTAHPITMWDWETDYKNHSSPNIFTPSYNKTSAFSPWQFPPSHLNPTSSSSAGLPLLYDAYTAPHAGYLSAVTFRFAYGLSTDIQIKRVYGFGVNQASSKLNLRCRIKDAGTTNTTFYDVGTFLNGPSSGGQLGTLTNSAPAPLIRNFAVNPRINLIPFKKDDEITFDLIFVNNSLISDSIKVQVDPATTGTTTVAGVIAYFHFYIES